jgi:dTDP-4-dehydrorhamnose reductase
MLGRAFQHELVKLVPSAQVHAKNKIELDIRSPDDFAVYDAIAPHFVIHCAALVDADRCEDHPEEGRESIVEGTRHAIEYAKRSGAKLFYPQSFLIHDGRTPIDEDTAPEPLCVYGRLKAEAESLILDKSAGSSLSVRMGGFFGGAQADDNFVGRMTPHLARLLREGKSSIDIGNRVWQPTYTHDLAANSLLLLAHGASGIYCMASHGSASFHELTVEIARLVGIDQKIRIGRVDASLLASKERASRPLKAEMTNKRLQAEGLDRQRTWQYSLAEYLANPYFKELFQ